MKTGEPITPIMDNMGSKIAEMRVKNGRPVVSFTYVLEEFDKDALQGIIDLMEKKELDLLQEKK